MSLPFRVLAVASLVLASSTLVGCGDDVSCIFTTGCQGGPGGPGDDGNPAVLPRNGQWISDARPVITDVFPRGDEVHPSAPIVLVFSESMNPDSLEDAFEIVAVIPNPFLPAVQIERQALIGDGRVLVLFPSADLSAGGFRVRLALAAPAGGGGNPFGGGGVQQAPGDPVTDLTGQELDETPGTTLGDVFRVVSAPPVEPRVVATWPADDDAAASQSTPIVVVFDRAIDAATVTDASFDVRENNMAPTLDPVAAPLVLGTGMGTAEPRVFIWQSADAAGVISPLAVGAPLEVRLGAAIRDLDGEALVATDFSFTIAPFAAPASATIRSSPTDAIGRRNLDADGTDDLSVRVDLVDAQDGDLLDLFLFGTNTSETDPRLIALRRQVTLSGVAPITMRTFSVTDIDLAVDDDPDEARFADGAVSFAFRLRRGATLSPLRVLDVDPASEGIQDPLLDTVAPVIQSFDFGAGTTDVSVSNVRDLVLSGTADSVIRSVEVSANDSGTMMTNGMLPPVVGTREDGAFLAAPVEFGVLTTGSAAFTATAYDNAFNASTPVSGTFAQRGGVGPGAFANGDMLFVEVFDVQTLLPLEDALVVVHADLGDGINYPLTDSALTGMNGTATLATNAAAIGSIVTVDLDGYDLFSFHGVSSDVVSIPLEATGLGASASVVGDVMAQDAAIELILPGLDRRMDDSRRPSGVQRFYSTAACIPNPIFTCAFGPEPIAPDRIGVQTFVAGNFQATENSFNPALLIQAFCLETPLGSVGVGSVQDTTFTLPFLLIDSSVVVEEKPDELNSFLYGVGSPAGIDETNVVPTVTVEANVPGVAGTVAVGLGLAFAQGGGDWKVRSARPGAVSPAGFFGVNGTVDTDLFVRCELRDAGANVSGVRSRISTLGSMPLQVTVDTPDVPTLTVPAPGGMIAGPTYDLRFADSIPDSTPGEGLYRVRLRDLAGRGWTLYKVDSPGGAEVRVHVPDIGDPLAGGTPLMDGAIDVTLEAFAWPTFAWDAFLWTDIEREHDQFARSEVTFTQL